MENNALGGGWGGGLAYKGLSEETQRTNKSQARRLRGGGGGGGGPFISVMSHLNPQEHSTGPAC